MDVTTLKGGEYFDADEMLRDRDGNLMPDGMYKTLEGEVFMYEGNHEALMRKIASVE